MTYRLLGFKPSHPCASGTIHSDGGAIGAAIRDQHAKHLRLAAAHDRARRSDAEIRLAYEQAMKEKRQRSK